MINSIDSIDSFYKIINRLKKHKHHIVNKYFSNKSVSSKDIQTILDIYYLLLKIPGKSNKYIMNLSSEKIYFDLSYEICELQKDLIFLKKSEKFFLEYLNKKNENFKKEVEEGTSFLKNTYFYNFITGRDGTINNHCQRFNSSTQSIYNSVFLTLFAKLKTKNAIILTGAPLENTGIADLCINPKNTFIYAGSDGREFMDLNGKRHNYLIKKNNKEKFIILSKRINDFFKQNEYRVFSLIGSGIQIKHGEITIARQDIYNSINKKKSALLLNKIKKLIHDVDPLNEHFSINLTKCDIEITLFDDYAGKDFTKGKGLHFIDNNLDLQIEKGPNLICGDNYSDLDMLKTTKEKTNKNLAIFVTKDNHLKRSVKNLCKNAYFVSSPDILITILYKSTNS